MTVDALVLSAGLGERLRPLTEVVPKPLIPVLGEPVISYVVEQLAQNGIDNVHVNAHWHAGMLGETLRKIRSAVNLHMRYESRLLGAAGSLRALALERNADAFLVCPNDLIHDADLSALVAAHEKSRMPITILAAPAPSSWDGDRLQIGADGMVERYLPSSGDVTAPLGSFGVCIVDRRFAAQLESHVEALTGHVVPEAVKRGWAQAHVQEGVHVVDVGTPELLRIAALEVVEGRYGPQHRDHGMRGHVAVERLRAAGHDVRGDVYVSERARLGHSLRLSGPLVVSDGVVVGDGARVERSVLLPGTEVPAGSLVHGALLTDSTGLTMWRNRWELSE